MKTVSNKIFSGIINDYRGKSDNNITQISKENFFESSKFQIMG